MLVGVWGAIGWQEPRCFCDAEAVDSILLARMVMSYANFSLILEIWKLIFYFEGTCFAESWIKKKGFL